jgi:hypothetical protein
VLGKETIDSYNQSENRGAQTSHGLNYQKLGKDNSYAAALLKALFHLPLTLPRLGGPVAGQLLLGPLFPGVSAGRRRSGRVHHHPLQSCQTGITHEISCHILFVLLVLDMCSSRKKDKMKKGAAPFSGKRP